MRRSQARTSGSSAAASQTAAPDELDLVDQPVGPARVAQPAGRAGEHLQRTRDVENLGVREAQDGDAVRAIGHGVI
jgi:hypothetical protein